MAVIETWFKQNLDKAVQVQTLSGVVFTDDNEGNLIGVRCYKDGAAAQLSGSVSAYAIRQDEQTVTIINGVLANNAASIVLPSEALEIPGVIHIIIRLTNGNVRTTLCAVRATVQRSRSENIIHGERVIYSIDDMLRQIAACETATTAAVQATSAATTAASAANQSATSASQAATSANTAAGSAETATTNANTQAERAKEYADCFDHAYVNTGEPGTDASVVIDKTAKTITFTIPRGINGNGSVNKVEGINPDANNNISLDSLIVSQANVETMVNNLF